MNLVTRRNAITTIELVLGMGLIVLSMLITYNNFKPIPGGHIDGRGMFTLFIIPPTAALGGCLIAHIVPRYFQNFRNRIVRYAACTIFSVLAVIPSVAYILFFGGEDVSKSLATYDMWFVIALIVGLAIAGISDIRSW